jgi:hypothetical protein
MGASCSCSVHIGVSQQLELQPLVAVRAVAAAENSVAAAKGVGQLWCLCGSGFVG